MTSTSNDAASKLEHDRNLIRARLAVSPAERVHLNTGGYRVWVHGQRNLARHLALRRGVSQAANYTTEIALLGHPVPQRFLPEEVFKALTRHGVDFIVIGGLAAVLYGAPWIATDLDISVEGTQANLERTTFALRSIGGLRWTASELTAPTGAADLQHSPERVVTDFGNVDIFQLHPELTGHGPTVVDLEGLEVAVIDFPSLVLTKTQDQRAGSGFQLHHLRLLADERGYQDRVHRLPAT